LHDAESQRFGIVASVESDMAVLGMWGEFDLVTAPTLSVFLDAVMRFGRRHIVLDLARRVGAASHGGRVVAAEAQGGSLTVRSPSAMTAKILEITGLAPELGLHSHADDPAPFVSGSISHDNRRTPRRGLSAIDPQGQGH
jgi:anti-anti-sigma factor